MPIHFEHSIDVRCRPEQAFGVVDDFGQTPKWLSRCTRIEADGPHAVGTKLKYDYRDGGRTGTMQGEITVRQPCERLTMHYADAMMDVTVDFRIAPRDSGSRLTHAIDIAPKTFAAKLLAPLIGMQVPKQTIAAMEKLRGLLEAAT